MIRNTMLAVASLAALVACDTPEENALAGAAAGAALGTAIADDDNELEGAVVEGIVGAAAGAYIGRDARGRCIYRRADGTRFIAAC